MNKNVYHQTQFTWKLFRYMGEINSGKMGEIILPVEQLDGDLTIPFLNKELNSRNIFDFEYSPSEGDSIEIRKDYIYKNIIGQSRPELDDYLSFIYTNGKWKDDVYDAFNDKTKCFKRGKVRYL